MVDSIDANGRVRIGVSVSSFFDPVDKEAVHRYLAADFEVYETSPQRGGFPMPIEIFFEIPWGTVADISAIVGQLIVGVRYLLARFRVKSAEDPNPDFAAVPMISVRAAHGDRTVEAILYTADEAYAETALSALRTTLEVTLNQEQPEPYQELHYDEQISEWRL